MSFLAWMGVVGGLLLFMALSSAYLRKLPITTSAVYLGFGLAVGPIGLGWVRIDLVEYHAAFEHLTEIAVITSLFVGGLKLRLPFRNPAWVAAFRLAGPVMVASIAAVAVFSHYVFGFAWPVAFFLGAVLAPTDPVLASTVSVADSADQDRMRYGLSGEAGFNDGAAFPFVIFALLWMEHDTLGSWVGGWAISRIVWAIPAGLIAGYFLGKGVGRLAIWLRARHQDTEAPDDFLALSLIALAYVIAETLGGWGFLAAFTAGVGFRRAEMKTVLENPVGEFADASAEMDSVEPVAHPPAEDLVGINVNEEELKHPTKAAGVVVSEIVSFGDTAERLLEVMMVVIVGICVSMYWDWRAVPIALALFFVFRPLAVLIFLTRTPTGMLQRLMMGWFGIRGIGSLYYLSYALSHGLKDNVADITAVTLSVIALSILIHGVSSQPILNMYERRIAAVKH
jgi:NhaP-type Na+/H+ or K+/H+ antiporter